MNGKKGFIMFINLKSNFEYSNYTNFGSKKKKKKVSCQKNEKTIQENKQDIKNQENTIAEDNSTLVVPSDYGRRTYGFDYYVSNPTKLSDTKPLTEVDEINKTLETKYGIKSDIKNPELLKAIHSAVKDFCDVNETDDLFKNGEYKLVLQEERFDNKQLFRFPTQTYNYEYRMYYNSNVDNWMQQNRNEIKDSYNKALINTDNPNYTLYMHLTNFLLSTHKIPPNQVTGNIVCYNDNQYVKYKNKDIRKTFLKLTHISESYAMTGEYIVNKMLRIPVPKYCDKVFPFLSNKINLKFPQIEEKQVHIREAKREELTKIKEILKDKYGINADFKGNTTYANAILSSVESLTKAAKDNNIFNGLDIEIDKKYFEGGDEYNTSGKCIEDKKNEGRFFIAFNPYLNLKMLEEGKNESYKQGEVATNNIVHASITHELAHWLQWNCPNNYPYNCIDKGIQFINRYNNNGCIDTKDCYNSTDQRYINCFNLSAAVKVSLYAIEDAGEFCSEYVAGKMDGKKYPKMTDELFKTLWRGPKLNFPEPCN